MLPLSFLVEICKVGKASMCVRQDRERIISAHKYTIEYKGAVLTPNARCVCLSVCLYLYVDFLAVELPRFFVLGRI